MSLKDQVLAALLSRDSGDSGDSGDSSDNREGAALSGEALAKKLGVTRSAVWKAVRQLRAEGFAVEAGPNRGYVLAGCDTLSSAAIAHAGDGGFAVEIHDCLGSTNDRAKELAAGGARKLCVIADRQEGGKGRMGRSFFSPPGAGLYLSMILHPAIRGEDCALLTTYAAVAVAEAIEELTGAQAGIKWVNDVYLGGKKICGILTEASVDFETGGFAYAVVGIGINVRKAALPEELVPIVTDLETETGVQVDRNKLASALLRRFADVDAVLRESSYLASYSARCFVLGKDVLVTRGAEQFSAHAVAINERGELLVDDGSGTIRALNSGEVSVKVKPTD